MAMHTIRVFEEIALKAKSLLPVSVAENAGTSTQRLGNCHDTKNVKAYHSEYMLVRI